MKNHIEENNTRKIIRALEVCSKSGRPFSEQLKKGKPKYALLFMGVKTDRKELYERINKRVDEMLASGGWEEAKNIWQKYEANLPSASAIGYRQLFSYFEGKISKKEAMELLKRDTRRYAKRQLTWFNRDKRIKWIKSFKEADKLTRDFLK